MNNQGSDSLRSRVGKYDLGRILGEGTFAKVRFAKNRETGQFVAIKILDKEKVFRDRLVEQVKMKYLPYPALWLNFCSFLSLDFIISSNYWENKYTALH